MEHMGHSKSKSTGQKGSALTEYALLCSLIAIVCISSVKLLTQNIGQSLDQTTMALAGIEVYDSEEGGQSGGCSGGTTESSCGQSQGSQQ